MAEFFEEGRAPTPPPEGSSSPTFMGDYPEGESPWKDHQLATRRSSGKGRDKGKGVDRRKPSLGMRKPYTRASTSKR